MLYCLNIICNYVCVFYSSFNVLAYSTKVSQWKSNLVPSTEDNRTEAQEWIGSLSTGGSSCLLEAIIVSESIEIHLILFYIIT